MGTQPASPAYVDVALPVPVDKTFTYKVPPSLSGRLALGCRVLVPFGRRRMTGYVMQLRKTFRGRFRLKEIAALIDEEPLLTPALLELARWMAGYYVHAIGEVLRAVLPAAVKGRGRIAADEDADAPFPEEIAYPVLNEDQQASFDAVTREVALGTHHGFLLHGITGSGKTEVYLRCIDEALQEGKSALVLIPEIALIPQTTARFRRRFGGGVAVLHGRLTGAQRCTIWTKAVRGEVRVVIGARSAVFVPLKDLGIIVVDEEQDGSYKQEEKPHYNAVDVARFRAKNEGAVLLLGSATPSLETYESSRKNEITYLKLRSRPVIDRVPEAKIVDMREREGVFSEELLGSLEACVERGEQAIVLLNRRGHASFIQCRKCGWIERCPYCSISLTYHSRGHRLVCHYCGHRVTPPETCRNCSAYKIAHRGVGTQRVEMELGNLLPGVRVARMDLDTTRGKRGHLKVLERFARGEADILLGTQMVAKGHHYPNVTVVGVVSADWGMNFPDFRAAERTFRLLVQAAGRAGRGEKEGTVIVQTLAPDHYLFQYLTDNDFEGFAERELAFRYELRYPPSEHLILFTVSSASLERAREAAGSAAETLNDLFAAAGFDVLGPTPAMIARLRGRYRFQVLVKGSPDVDEKKSAVAAVQAALARFKSVDVQWDVDPINL